MTPIAPMQDYSSQIREARTKRGVGALFMTLGILGIITAGVLGGVAGASGASDAFIVGMCVEAGSLLMFIPGLVSVVKNTKRIRKWEQWALSDDRITLVGLSAYGGREGGGLSLAIGF